MKSNKGKAGKPMRKEPFDFEAFKEKKRAYSREWYKTRKEKDVYRPELLKKGK